MSRRLPPCSVPGARWAHDGKRWILRDAAGVELGRLWCGLRRRHGKRHWTVVDGGGWPLPFQWGETRRAGMARVERNATWLAAQDTFTRDMLGLRQNTQIDIYGQQWIILPDLAGQRVFMRMPDDHDPWKLLIRPALGELRP